MIDEICPETSQTTSSVWVTADVTSVRSKHFVPNSYSVPHGPNEGVQNERESLNQAQQRIMPCSRNGKKLFLAATQKAEAELSIP